MGLKFDYKYGQTPIDENEKGGLLIESITTQGELNEFEQLNIERAIEWILRTSFSSAQILSEDFIKLVHKKMFDKVWKWAGKYRKSNKNIGVDWTVIGIELRSLLDDTKFWIENKIYGPDEIAIRFKFRLVKIHCFPNGNGRHSRIMADIIIESIFKKEVFSWNHSSMGKADELRYKYISALHHGENGDIEHLLKFARG